MKILIPVLISIFSFASELPILKTGQESSFINGDDGYYQKGIQSNLVRDDGLKVLKDNVTNLLWQDGEEIVSKTWSNAISYCEDLSFANFEDWRLPSLEELNTIVDYGKSSPAIKDGFLNTKSNSYWSSTPYRNDNSLAWIVDFSYGDDNWSYKTNSNAVRCVRSSDN